MKRNSRSKKPSTDSSKNTKSPGKSRKRKTSLSLEALEPRILLSGTWTDADTGNPIPGPTDGDDVFTGTNADESAAGAKGDDILYGHDGKDSLDGGEGNDRLWGGDGDDTLQGNEGQDILHGEAGNDKLEGKQGDDHLDGGTGNDELYGNEGSDTMVGGGGNDRMWGDIGDDTFRFTGAQNGDVYTVDGGQDTDTIDLSPYQASQVSNNGSQITVDLGGGQSFTINHTGVENVVTAPNNTPPDAVNDAVSTNEDVAVTTGNLLANDTDPDGHTLTVNAFTQGANGAVAYNNDGTFTYTPNANFNGSDSFTYTVSDGNGGTDTATVNVTVNAVDDTVRDEFAGNNFTGNNGTTNWESDWSEIGESNGASSGVVRVTGGALRIGGDEVSLTGRGVQRGVDLNGATNATLSLDYRRTVDEDDNGSVALQISSNGGTNWTTLHTYNLNKSDPAYVQQNFNISAHASANTQVRLIGSGSTDDGAYLYIDNVQITFDGPNQPGNIAPVASNADLTLNEDSSGVVTLAATDANPGDAIEQHRIESLPGNGTLLLNGNAVNVNDVVTQAQINAGNLTFTPNQNWNGATNFSFRAYDGEAWSVNQAAFSITVNAVNDAPDAVNDAVSTNEDVAVTTGNLLANDSDPDGHALTVNAFTQGANGAVAYNNDGTFTYTPNANFHGSDSFTYTVSDGNGGTDTATVNVTVNAVNDAPDAVNDAVSTNEDVAVTTGNVLANDTDEVAESPSTPSSGTAPHLVETHPLIPVTSEPAPTVDSPALIGEGNEEPAGNESIVNETGHVPQPVHPKPENLDGQGTVGGPDSRAAESRNPVELSTGSNDEVTIGSPNLTQGDLGFDVGGILPVRREVVFSLPDSDQEEFQELADIELVEATDRKAPIALRLNSGDVQSNDRRGGEDGYKEISVNQDRHVDTGRKGFDRAPDDGFAHSRKRNSEPIEASKFFDSGQSAIGSGKMEDSPEFAAAIEPLNPGFFAKLWVAMRGLGPSRSTEDKKTERRR